ncbi:hypothetical protein, partial [Intestinirhabdus alba]
MSESEKTTRPGEECVRFKKRYLAGLVSTLLVTSYPFTTAAAPLFVADDNHDSKVEINGGTYDAAYNKWADAVIFASGTGKEINARDITITTTDETNDNKSVFVENGATVTLNKATINSAVLRSSGGTLNLYGVDINNAMSTNIVSAAQNGFLNIKDSTINFLNGIYGYGLVTADGVTVDIDNLTTNGEGYFAETNGKINNSTFNHSSIFTGMASVGSTLTLDNTHIFNKHIDSNGRGGAGFSLTKKSNIDFQHGTIESAGKALEIIASEFTGNDLKISSMLDRAVEATQGSTLTLTDTEVGGTIGIYANASTVNLTDVDIRLEAPAASVVYSQGIWLLNTTNCTGTCGTAQLTRTNVETKGDTSHAISVTAGASAKIDDSVLITHGEKAYGVHIAGGNSSASPSVVTMTGGEITTSGKDSHGVLVRNGQMSKAILKDMTIANSGEYSAAMGVWEGASLEATNVTVNSSGLNSDIFYLRDGSALLRNKLTVRDSTLVNSQGNAIYGHGFSKILLQNSTVTAKGRLLTAYSGSDIQLDLDKTIATGDIKAAADASVTLSLLNASRLTGAVSGVNDF